MADPSQVLLVVLFLATGFGHSSARWCVCKDGLSEAVLQRTLDYACGAGADCNPIRPSGACYSPSSVRAHCSYAVNSYFQKRNEATGTCDFGGTATLTTSNPSSNGCSFPASASGSGTTGTSPSISVPSTTPTTTTPTTSPVTTTPVTGGNPTVSGTPTTSSPYTTTVQPSTGTSTTTTSSPYTTTVQPSTGTSTTTTSPTTSSYPNGLSSGIAPTGDGMNDNHGGIVSPPRTAFCLVCMVSLMLLLLHN